MPKTSQSYLLPATAMAVVALGLAMLLHHWVPSIPTSLSSLVIAVVLFGVYRAVDASRADPPS
jgi:CHASE2 domain-containing sensor protein